MSNRKQYINSSNNAPTAFLVLPWLLSLTIYDLGWPVWLHAISMFFGLCLFINFAVRKSTEDGVDVVNR